MNAELELLRSVTCNSEVPEFVIETLLVGALPRVTSPNSIEDGLATRGAAFVVDENALESDPQPESTRLRIMVPATAIAPRAIGDRIGDVVSQLLDLATATALASKKEERRILIIRRHLSQSGQPMQKTPLNLPRGMWLHCFWLTLCRIDP